MASGSRGLILRKLILIAIGNPLRGDDGAAHRVLEGLRREGYEARSVLQLTPELAEDIAGYETVVFLDADTRADCVSIEPAPLAAGNSPLTHVASVAQIDALARSLYGFNGQILLCRIPAADFSPGEGLSARAGLAVAQAIATLPINARRFNVPRQPS